MDTQHLLNVLSMLRLMKGKNSENATAASLITRWAGQAVNEPLTLKIAAHIQEEIALSVLSLEKARLSDEAKEGILPKLKRLQEGFGMANLNTAIRQFAPDVSGMITTIAVVTEASGVEPQAEQSEEADSLIRSIEETIAALDPDMDPILRDIAIRHMQVLVAMLQNLRIFGSEIAYTAYFELLKKIERADAFSSDTDREKAKPFIDRIKGWGEVMASIQKIWDAGSGIITAGAKLVPLLSHQHPSP